MTVVKTIRVDLIGETSDFRKDMKDAEKSVENFQKSAKTGGDETKKFGDKLSGVATAAAGWVAANVMMQAGGQVIQFGKDSIAAASDVEEMQSKFDTVFRDLAGGVEDELGVMADAMNRSKYDLMGYAATFQDTFVPLGFARDTAAEMSVTMVELAEDLASFNNLRTEDVARDLQSALVGNTETLRKYGVVAQEAQIKAKALEMGLWDGEGAVDAQSKALAILEIALDGTTDAQGDAERTADSFANANRGLEASIKDLQVEVGRGLTPAISNMIPHLDTAIDSVTNFLRENTLLTEALNTGAISMEEWDEVQFKVQDGTWDMADVVDFAAGRIEYQNQMLDWANAEHEEFKQRTEESKQAAEEFAEPVEEAAISSGLLAEQLGLVAFNADDAKGAMEDLFNEGIKLVTDGIVEQERLKTVMEIATKDLTAAEIEQKLAYLEELGAMEAVNLALEDDLITRDEWIAIVADGKVTQAELNEVLGITEEEIWDIKEAVESTDGVHATATVEIITIGSVPDTTTLGAGQQPIPRAGGGDVWPGQPYLVGEEGPEVVMFQQRGHVFPNGEGGGGGGDVNIYIEGNDPLAIAAEVERVIRRNWRMAANSGAVYAG